ncbi:MAG TPA: S-layer homology domain-containing protein [Anaerolineae bacterium]|nr:S-layer homology domain-containing protein [Anaerolineae bacterium]
MVFPSNPCLLPLISFYSRGALARESTALSRAKELGIISGYPDNAFRPTNPATRAEASKMVEALVK